MAAATSTSAYANKSALWRALQRALRGLRASNRPKGVFALESPAITVATTNIDDIGDELRLIQFPDGDVRLLSLRVEASAMDAGTTLAGDFITDDGSTEVVLINDSTIGQAGGTDELDANIDMDSLEVGGKYLAFKVGTAATTPAAGTVKVFALVYIDPVTNW